MLVRTGRGPAGSRVGPAPERRARVSVSVKQRR